MANKRFADPLSLMRHKAAQLHGMRVSTNDAVGKVAAEMKADGVHFSSGGLKQKLLTQLGHPFGRGPVPNSAPHVGLKRGGSFDIGKTRVKVPNLPLNVQSGKLRSSFYVRRQSGGPGKVNYLVGNTAKHAKFILSPWGTRLMVGRGFWGSPKYSKGAPMGKLARNARARLKGVHIAVSRKVRNI